MLTKKGVTSIQTDTYSSKTYPVLYDRPTE